MRVWLLIVPISIAVPSVAFAAININSASYDELDALPGVGEVTINRILSHRQNQGGFQNISEVCALVGTNGVGVDTQTCQNIEAAIYFGSLDESPSAISSESDDEKDDASSTKSSGNKDQDEIHKQVSGLTLTMPSIAYAGQVVDFDVEPNDGTDGRLVRYSWSFGDGEGSQEKSPTHEYRRPGKYVIVVESYFQKEFKTARRELTVLPLSLEVSSVPGGVEVVNHGTHEIDLGGMSVNDFTFPKHTILLPSERLVLEGVTGRSFTFFNEAGKSLPLYSTPARVSTSPAQIPPSAPVPKVTEADVATTTTEVVPSNLAAVATADLPKNTWPYLGILAVMAFGFVALYGTKPS